MPSKMGRDCHPMLTSKPMIAEHPRRTHREPAVGRCGCSLNELALDLVNLHRCDATKANTDGESTVPLLRGVNHRLARHPVVSQCSELRGMPSRTKCRVSSDSDNVEDATPKDETGDEVSDLIQHCDVGLDEIRRNRTSTVAEHSERTVGVCPVVGVGHEPSNCCEETRKVTDILTDVGVIGDSPERAAHQERPGIIFGERGPQVRVASSSLPARACGRGHEPRLWARHRHRWAQSRPDSSIARRVVAKTGLLQKACSRPGRLAR